MSTNPGLESDIDERQRLNDVATWALLALVILSHWVIALKYIPRMWSYGQYQFFPLVFLVVGWLFWQRRKQISDARTDPSPRVLKAWLLIGFGAVVFVTMAGSSSLGMVSFISALATVIYWCVGRGGLRASIPLLFLLCFVIPLPLSLDQRLVIRLQFLASQMASWLLDAVGEIHFRQGVILITENNRFLTEEACSGIRSLYSSLTAIAIYGIINRYRWWRHLLNLIQVFFWVIVGNALRVAIVVYVTDHFTDKVATGLGHELLGLAVFLFIFAMAISTDCLVSLLLRTEFYPAFDDQTAGLDQGQRIRPAVLLGRPATIALLSLFVGANLIGARVAYARYWNKIDLWSYQMERLPAPAEADMPPRIGDWQLIKFQHVNRGKEQIQAEDSYIWMYSDGDLTALMSVDCPWTEWHDLRACYLALGWKTEPTYLIQSRDNHADIVEEPARTHSEIRMRRDNMHGFVVFSSVDRNRQPVLPPLAYTANTTSGFVQQMFGDITDSLALTAEDRTKMRGIALPASTLQLYCAHGSDLTEEQLERLRQLFFDARRLILNSPRYRGRK